MIMKCIFSLFLVQLLEIISPQIGINTAKRDAGERESTRQRHAAEMYLFLFFCKPFKKYFICNLLCF